MGNSMYITFCGHSDYVETPEDRQNMMWTLAEVIGDRPANLYFCENGAFDGFAFSCCKEYKKTHPKVRLINVSADIMEWFYKTDLDPKDEGYDRYFFPPALVDVPTKFAVAHRNYYILDETNWVISYITHEQDTAYTMYEYAYYLGSKVVNLAHKNISDIISVDITLDLEELAGGNKYSLLSLFRRFRAHKELLEDPDYKRLYDEILEESYKNSPEQTENKEGEIALHEAVGDLMVKDFSAEPERISAEPLTCLLKQRKRIWNLV